ncbi:hypothetical protein [Corynebacterium aquatimens]|uniref:Secreted protein n=1 Tax=Corynebacterium aquatimens TaxID=1190508 RepID=A0A931DYS7_9CORY|nr:hypothetical protein [Corynebacterium aquatimens]MBG6121504.1 hypothetical protein [Corynebacterium aquatimens]WJY65953.1 hypothetical protein CAQUA_06240 [Corynebacterium aquatimens]
MRKHFIAAATAAALVTGVAAAPAEAKVEPDVEIFNLQVGPGICYAVTKSDNMDNLFKDAFKEVGLSETDYKDFKAETLDDVDTSILEGIQNTFDFVPFEMRYKDDESLQDWKTRLSELKKDSATAEEELKEAEKSGDSKEIVEAKQNLAGARAIERLFNAADEEMTKCIKSKTGQSLSSLLSSVGSSKGADKSGSAEKGENKELSTGAKVAIGIIVPLALIGLIGAALPTLKKVLPPQIAKMLP